MATTKQSAKQKAQKVLDSLPRETSRKDIQCHLYILQRIERGRADIRAGRAIHCDDVEQRMSRWLET